MIGLRYGEKGDDMLSRLHLIAEHHGRTDRRTDRIAISISHVIAIKMKAGEEREREKEQDSEDRWGEELTQARGGLDIHILTGCGIKKTTP